MNLEKINYDLNEQLIDEICLMFQMIRKLKTVSNSKGPSKPELTPEQREYRNHQIMAGLLEAKAKYSRPEFVEDEKFAEDQAVYQEMLANGQDPFGDGYSDGYDIDELYQALNNSVFENCKFSYLNIIKRIAYNIECLFNKIELNSSDDGYGEDGYYDVTLNKQYNDYVNNDHLLSALENIEFLLLHYKYAQKQEKARKMLLQNTDGSFSRGIIRPNKELTKELTEELFGIRLTEDLLEPKADRKI